MACVLLRPALSAGHGARHTPAAPPSASVSLCPDSHPRPWCQDLPALQTHRLPPDPGLHLRPRGPPGRPGDWRPERPGAPACLPSLTLAHSWGPEFENGFCACVVFSRRLKRRGTRGAAHPVAPEREMRAPTQELGGRCNRRLLQGKVHSALCDLRSGGRGTLKRLASVSGLHSDKSLPPPSRLGFRFARFQLAEVYRGLKILNGTVWK